MKLSREARRQSHLLFEMAMDDGSLNLDRLRTIFDEVAAKKPRQYVQILKEITRLVRLELASRHAIVESAQTLDPELASRFSADLATRFGDVTTEFRTNPALIGGVRVQVGSDVWDGSIQARLESLKQLL